jgi:hypothetical protein
VRTRREVLAALAVAGAVRGESGEPEIDAQFPGGNIVVERVSGDDVFVHQDLRDTEGHWFYWAFRVRHAAGRNLTFRFTNGDVVGVRGPAVSVDLGRSWRWLGAESGDARSFRYAFSPGAREVRFAVSIPYQEADLARFLQKHRGNRLLRVETLTRSKKNRAVELLRAGSSDAPHRVMLTARHHSCESTANYVLEGLLSTVLSATPDGRWLARNVDFFVVPFVDKDGVEDGDQGKNRRPRDHNRDYDGESVHPEVRAIREQVPLWAGDRIRVALDLHCPTLRGRHNETIYFVGGRDPAIWREVERFAGIVEREQRGPLKYSTADNVPFGTAWNTAGNTTQGTPCAHWTAQLGGIRMASTLEFSYSNANGGEVTADSARAFGADLARGLRVYLGAL